MGQVALPFTLTADTKASATQVQQNLQALLNAINGALDHTNLKADSQSLSQVANAILQIMQAASGVGALNDVQIASGQQLVWGTDAALYRIGAGVLGAKGDVGGVALGAIITALGKSSAIKVQYGTLNINVAASGTNYQSTVTYPTAFSSNPYVLAAIGSAGTTTWVMAQAGNVTATNFAMSVAAGAILGSFPFLWLAIGN